MKKFVSLFLIASATLCAADETRQLVAHEHGVGTLDIAVSGQTITMELRAPGADIVGFEYEASSDQDRAAIIEAVALLARPLELFVFPAEAKCRVSEASADLDSDKAHVEHTVGKDENAHNDHNHDHNEHAEKANHTEFHAEYVLNCNQPDAVSEIYFAYFATFDAARELEVQFVAQSVARAFEVTWDNPRLDLRGLF